MATRTALEKKEREKEMEGIAGIYLHRHQTLASLQTFTAVIANSPTATRRPATIATSCREGASHVTKRTGFLTAALNEATLLGNLSGGDPASGRAFLLTSLAHSVV